MLHVCERFIETGTAYSRVSFVSLGTGISTPRLIPFLFLLIAGRGYITVSENEDFNVLHPPFKMDNVFDEGDHYEGHIMAVYHQLHCLVSLRRAITSIPR